MSVLTTLQMVHIIGPVSTNTIFATNFAIVLTAMFIVRCISIIGAPAFTPVLDTKVVIAMLLCFLAALFEDMFVVTGLDGREIVGHGSIL